MEQKDYQSLYKKYLHGNCSPEELTLLFDYFKTADKDSLQRIIQNNFQLIEDEHQPGLEERNILNNVFVKVKANTHPKHKTRIQTIWLRLRPFSSIAAAAIILIALTFALYKHESSIPIHKEQTNYPIDVAPGGNKATLKLPNGEIISLSTDKGEIVMDSSEIVYSDGTKVMSGQVAVKIPQLITLSTPNGGQYKVILPDGSKVWLNATSSITYPTKFRGNERRVVLTGEAYFEVETTLINTPNHNMKIPFIVESNGQEVRVLGTGFNINSYADEPVVKTTLIEGSVIVSNPNTLYSAVLKPNQQSMIGPNSKRINVSTVDTKKAIAWRDGLFHFNETDINAIMRQISRWYDVDISYEGKIKYAPFYGEIQRNYNLSEVLKVLELSGVSFRVEDNQGKKQIIVTN